ncbi:MAG: hypothetical protein CFE22_11125 [Cytophagaceae bacterium BCCC1]|nr:MAG: hypothetical protein CFE22_11125 [Cytophagaceae bacterium BCCC1]
MKLINNAFLLTLKGELFKVWKGRYLLTTILASLIPTLIYKFIKLSKLNQIYYLSNYAERNVTFIEFATDYDIQSMFVQLYILLICLILILFENDKKANFFQNLTIFSIGKLNFYLGKQITIFIILNVLLALLYFPNLYISNYYYEVREFPSYFTKLLFYFSTFTLIVFTSNVYLILKSRVYLFLLFSAIFLYFPTKLNPIQMMKYIITEHQHLPVKELIIIAIILLVSFIVNRKNIYG